MAERLSSRRDGVMVFEISEDEYLEPGALLDYVLTLVAREGVFIGRLTTWKVEVGLRHGDEILKEICDDRKLNVFRLDWLKRYTIINKTAYFIDPVQSETVDAYEKGELKRLQKATYKELTECDLRNSTKTLLGEALKSGMDTFLNKLLDILEDKSANILYIQNVNYSKDLPTTDLVAMSDMVTNLHLLNGGQTIPGINSPTVSVGLEWSTFNAHREDMAFAAVNRHIAGPGKKVWFCIPPRYYKAFLDYIETLPFTGLLKKLKCFIQHKKIWIDPRHVEKHGIPVITIVQEPGDIIFLLPYTIHWGVNTGVCISQAMNFVGRSWVLPGMLADNPCQCIPDWLPVFNIEPTLNLLGADKTDISAWKDGHTAEISKKLRKENQLLHPGCTPGSEEENEGQPLRQDPGHDEGEEDSGSETEEAGIGCPRCLLCDDYCPGKFGKEGFKRIRAHALKMHRNEAEGMMVDVRIRWSRESRSKRFKGARMTCEICNAIIHGKNQQMTEHQNTVKCKQNKI